MQFLVVTMHHMQHFRKLLGETHRGLANHMLQTHTLVWEVQCLFSVSLKTTEQNFMSEQNKSLCLFMNTCRHYPENMIRETGSMYIWSVFSSSWSYRNCRNTLYTISLLRVKFLSWSCSSLGMRNFRLKSAMTEPFLQGESNTGLKLNTFFPYEMYTWQKANFNVKKRPRTSEWDVFLPESMYLSFREVSAQSRRGPVEVSELGGAGWNMQRQTIKLKCFRLTYPTFTLLQTLLCYWRRSRWMFCLR